MVQSLPSQRLHRIPIRPSLKPTKRVQCIFCEKTFTNFARHLITHTKESDFECKDCSKIYNQKENLYRHQMIHTGLRPFECDLCEMKFKDKFTLQRHRRIHTQEEKETYECNSCKTKFRYKGSFERHQRTHKVPVSYLCVLCDSTFDKLSSFNDHLRMHAHEKPSICNLCKMEFPSKGCVQFHEATVHNNGNDSEATAAETGTSEKGAIASKSYYHCRFCSLEEFEEHGFNCPLCFCF